MHHAKVSRYIIINIVDSRYGVVYRRHLCYLFSQYLLMMQDLPPCSGPAITTRTRVGLAHNTQWGGY